MTPEAFSKPARLACSPIVHMLLIAIVALIAYSNSFDVPFVFDDEPSITKNDVVQNLANFFANRSGYDYLPNRYMGNLSFALNYHFGGANVFGYHLVNLAIHIANALLVYALVRLTLRTPFFVNGPGSGDRGPEDTSLRPYALLPFFAAILFVCHPIQTQAVTYIVQRLTSLVTLFYLGALVLHVRWRLAREAGAPFPSRSVIPFWLLSLLSAVLAMKTKEIAFTLPLAVLLYECSFFGLPSRRRIAELVPLLLTIAIIPLSMLTLQKPVGEVLSDVSKATMEGTTLSRWEYLCTQLNVIVTYLRLLVFPVNQNLDYDYPASHSLLEPRTALSLLLLLSITGFALWLWRRSIPRPSSLSTHRVLRLPAFGIIWFFLTLSVESSVIPITDVIFEHRLYLPSVGFFIALVTLGTWGYNKWRTRSRGADKAAAALVVLVVLLLTGATYARNTVWGSWETLWLDVKRKSPMKARAYNNLGAYYVKVEKPAEAIREFERAVELNPRYLDSLYNLAMLYVWAGRFSEAKRISDTLQQLDPETFRTLDAMYGNK